MLYPDVPQSRIYLKEVKPSISDSLTSVSAKLGSAIPSNLSGLWLASVPSASGPK